MPHHVAVGQPHRANPVDAAQGFERLGQTRTRSGGQIHLGWHAAVEAAGSPVLGGGALWVVDYDKGVLYTLDPGSGSVRQQLAIGTAPHFASPTLAGGKAFVGTLTGVTAINPG